MILKLFFMAVVCAVAAVISLEKWAGTNNADVDATAWLEWFQEDTWERHLVAGSVVALAAMMSLVALTSGSKNRI
jgi:hypothetical protein